MVEKRWRGTCKSENETSTEGDLNYRVFTSLPSDSELAAAFVDRKRRSVENRKPFVLCFLFLLFCFLRL